MNHHVASKILIIDDDKLDYRIMKNALTKSGYSYEIQRSEDGIEGLAALKDQYEDTNFIVLLDLRMPKMSGLEFLEHLRSDEELKNTIVFVISTSDSESDIREAYQKGVCGYFTKAKDPTEALDLGTLVQKFSERVCFPDLEVTL